jgi:hypothetical protein
LQAIYLLAILNGELPPVCHLWSDMEVLFHEQVFIFFFLKAGSRPELLLSILLGEDVASPRSRSFQNFLFNAYAISIPFIWSNRRRL